MDFSNIDQAQHEELNKDLVALARKHNLNHLIVVGRQDTNLIMRVVADDSEAKLAIAASRIIEDAMLKKKDYLWRIASGGDS